MNFQRDGVYKLLELDKGLLLVQTDIYVKEQPGAEPLILADMPAMRSYLDRYLYERWIGRDLKEAHEIALKEAKIVKVIMPGAQPS